MNPYSLISLILYMVFGIVLAIAGVSVMEKPALFIVLILLVIGIELNARVRRD